MPEKMRVGGITISSDRSYSGKLVLNLLKQSFENGRLSAECKYVEEAYNREYEDANREHEELLVALGIIRSYLLKKEAMKMNDVTAKSLLIELQCTNKEITEAQNDALSYVISFLDEIVKKVDRGNYGIEKHMIKKAHPEYSDKEVEAYIQGYEDKEIEIRDKVNEEKAKETGLKLMPTEVGGLYLNIPEENEDGEYR